MAFARKSAAEANGKGEGTLDRGPVAWVSDGQVAGPEVDRGFGGVRGPGWSIVVLKPFSREPLLGPGQKEDTMERTNSEKPKTS